MGYTADRIMPISTSELALAYPDDYGPLPPALQLMVGQKGLNMPPAQILAQFPPPSVPYRTPRFGSLVLLYLYCSFLFCL
ncbi:hypothetical protein LINGRAHAP2_LOCUS29122 [Linum grandiflorum]